MNNSMLVFASTRSRHCSPLSSPSEERDELMMSSMKQSYRTCPLTPREPSRPTSTTRRNNPQATTFQTRCLPSGHCINVEMRIRSGRPDVAARRAAGGLQVLPALSPSPQAPLTPRSVAAQDFQTPQVPAEIRGNTKRYGSNSQPWANTTSPAVGIVPQLCGKLTIDGTTTSRAAFAGHTFASTAASPPRTAAC